MSTRAQVNFCGGKNVVAKIYIHGDGYPDGQHGMLARFEAFFADVTKRCKNSGPRFQDPSYLAAKFVVWQAHRNAKRYDFGDFKRKPKVTRTHRLDFLSIGIISDDAWDTEYVYTLDCTGPGKPAVGMGGRHDGDPDQADMTHEGDES